MGPDRNETPQERIARRLRTQAGWSRSPSPLYGRLLEHAARDAERGGLVADLLLPHVDDPGPSALALRLLAAVHRLALTGAAPNLARFYPSCDGDPSRPGLEDAFDATLAEHRAEIAAHVPEPVQTNEPGRAHSLLPGFRLVARETGLPLAIREVGASAGLLLRFDHITGATEIPVLDRRGCDQCPIDPTTADGRLALESFVWPDQIARMDRLRKACDIAAVVPAVVDRSSADRWAQAELAVLKEGSATVLYHSVFIQYPADDVRARLLESIAAAGEQATKSAPFAWLRFEPTREAVFETRLTLWPGGDERLVATSGPHGDDVVAST